MTLAHRERLRLALKHRPKRLLYPLLAIGRGGTVEPRSVDFARHRRVLLLREVYTIGDTLVATPAVRALKEAHPHLELALVAGWRNAAVWHQNPRLSRLFILQRGLKALSFARVVREVREWGPDACLTLESVKCHSTLDVLARASGAPLRMRYDGAAFGTRFTNAAHTCLVPFPAEPSLHQIDVCAGVLAPLGIPLADRRLEFFPGPAALAVASRVLAGAGVVAGSAFAVIHPGSKQVHNRWPLERFLAVHRHLLERGLRTLFSFGPSEEPARGWFLESGVEPRDLLPPLRLEELAATLRAARLLLCPDTGVLHVGAAVGVPIVGLYGSGDPRVWQPPGAVRAVSDHGRGNVRDVPVAAVLRTVDELLGEAAAGFGSPSRDATAAPRLDEPRATT